MGLWVRKSFPQPLFRIRAFLRRTVPGTLSLNPQLCIRTESRIGAELLKKISDHLCVIPQDAVAMNIPLFPVHTALGNKPVCFQCTAAKCHSKPEVCIGGIRNLLPPATGFAGCLQSKKTGGLRNPRFQGKNIFQ